MTQQPKRVTLFDAWAAQYNLDVAAGGDDFPFAGYKVQQRRRAIANLGGVEQNTGTFIAEIRISSLAFRNWWS